MGSTEGKRALIIFILSVVVAVLIMGALYTYVPAYRPYQFIVFIVLIFGAGFGACIVINIWGGNQIKWGKKY